MEAETGGGQTREEREPGDDVARWAPEFAAARKDSKKWRDSGERVVKRFRSEKSENISYQDKRLELFTSNIQTQQALLYGQRPQVSVTRRFNDSEDDVARVAAVILERCLNNDIEAPEDAFQLALTYSLEDLLLPGFGLVRVRYVAELETEPAQPAQLGDDGAELAPAVPEVEKKSSECVETDYVHWRDVLWSPCRNFLELRWVAFRAEMSREQLVERFGAIGRLAPLNSKRSSSSDGDAHLDPLARADVWELWDKESKKVRWLIEGFEKLLDVKDDPLELSGFWPFPRPMMANATTTAFMPVPDFKYTQDLYNQIDEETTRIALLERALRVAGVYDETSVGLQRLLSESSTMKNELIPVKGWAAFQERGGLDAAIAWLPLAQIIEVLERLRENRAENIQLAAQVSGMADIMRGQATDERDVTAREQGLKARFGSVRMQRRQDEFARFASDAQRLKAELMCRFYEPEEFFRRSNILQTPDKDFAQAAVELLKSDFGLYRVEVKPEAVSMSDMAKEQSEATEFITGVSTFLTAAAPLAATPAAPAVIELLKLFTSRFKFAGEAEGILDKAAAAAQQAQQGPGAPAQPDPKVIAAQIKVQGDLKKASVDHQNRMQELQAEAVTEQEKQQAQLAADIQSEAARAQIRVKEAHAMPKPPAPKGAA